MTLLSVANLVGSSQYETVADDSLKDEDNAAWVMTLEPLIRDCWLERIRWIRLIDRAAEHILVTTDREIDSEPIASKILAYLEKEKLEKVSSAIDGRSWRTWMRYSEAIAHYHDHELVIESLQEYEKMLRDLGGRLFQVLPFVSIQHWRAVYYLGALDQFYNNLRDLQEDSEQGICYFPIQLLNEFGVRREDILHAEAIHQRAYHAMMQFWLENYLPKLRQRAMLFVTAENLHPSWKILRNWSLHRYDRIERVFRECNFDYTQFSSQYWSEVRRELPTLLNNLFPCEAEVAYLNRWIAKFDRHQPCLVDSQR